MAGLLNTIGMGVVEMNVSGVTRRSRCDFPGIKLREARDADMVDIEICELRECGFIYILTLIRPINDFKRRFNVNNVAILIDGVTTELWRYQYKTHGSRTHIWLAKANDLTALAFVEKGPEGKVKSVLPLQTLRRPRTLSSPESIELKRLVGKYLERECIYNESERKVLTLMLATLRAQKRSAGGSEASAKQ